MSFTNELLNRYMSEVQPLFGEAEVIDQSIPLSALERISQFFDMLSLCVCGEKDLVDKRVTMANEYLSMARYHCHDVLTSAYCEQGRLKMAQYGYSALENANNATLYPKIETMLQSMATSIATAKELRCSEEQRVRGKYNLVATVDEPEGTVSFIEAEIAKSTEVREATEQSYRESKAFYDALMNNSMEINYSRDHGDDEQPVYRKLRISGQICTGIGVAALFVFVARCFFGA